MPTPDVEKRRVTRLINVLTIAMIPMSRLLWPRPLTPPVLPNSRLRKRPILSGTRSWPDCRSKCRWPPQTSRTAPPQPQHPHRQIKLRNSASSLQQFQAHPRQHVEDHADGQDKLRCNTEECADENLTRQHKRELSAVASWQCLPAGMQAQEYRRTTWNARRGCFLRQRRKSQRSASPSSLSFARAAWALVESASLRIVAMQA